MTVSKETRMGVRCVYLPTHDVVLDDVDTSNISNEQEIAYTEWCEGEIKKQLKVVEEENAGRLARWPEGEDVPEYVTRAMVRTHYPSDDFASEDVVALDDNGELVVLDAGSR